VTPYLAPDLLQSTLGATNGGGGASTSLQFRLPRQRSSLSNRQFVSTPLGPTRVSKPAVPLAHFDDDSSFGFQQQKQFVDASTDPILFPGIEQQDFSCQMTPFSTDKQIETVPLQMEYHSTQTDIVTTETIACQINPILNDCSIQTNPNEQKDFSCQFMPTSIDQISETIRTEYQTQTIQTDCISTKEYACQITPDYQHQQSETIPILTEEIGIQSSLVNLTFEDQQIQTDSLVHIDVETQYEYETPILPIVLTEEIPIVKIPQNDVLDQECQTIQSNLIQFNESTQTTTIDLIDSASQSMIITYESQSMQTEYFSNAYSSSLFIVPTSISESMCSSKIVIFPKEDQTIATADQEIQCELGPVETIVPVPINLSDRRSIIQHQLDEKEKQMNRIIGKIKILSNKHQCRGKESSSFICHILAMRYLFIKE
jgi:hypothetical protein